MNFKLCSELWWGGVDLYFQVYLFEYCFVGEFVDSDYGKCLLGLGIECTVGFV